ncbi:MAG: alpha/beta fold hydrolase [Acidimicrobiales bacterium]|nr:alpha/beta fold hydrolase [Acidimicrobiales bacterium]
MATPALPLDTTGAVVLHPHPSMGGDSSHPFVVDVAARLAALGATVATPDLHDPDVTTSAAALTDVAQSLECDRVVLVGYSWGSIVASHATPARLAGRVLVAPPASMPLGASGAMTPTLVLVPENDQYGGPDATQAALAGHLLVAMEVIPGADHFLWGSIEAIAQRCADWLTEASAQA